MTSNSNTNVNETHERLSSFKGHIEWHVPPQLWKKFQQSQPGNAFNSDLYTLSGTNLQFALKCKPFGGISQSANQIRLFLQIIFWPENISSIILKRTMQAKNMSHMFNEITIFTKQNRSWGWPPSSIPSTRLKDTTEEVFTCSLEIIGIMSLTNKQIPKSKWREYIGGGDVGAEEEQEEEQKSDSRLPNQPNNESLLMDVIGNIQRMNERMNALETQKNANEIQRSGNNNNSNETNNEMMQMIQTINARMKSMETQMNTMKKTQDNMLVRINSIPHASSSSSPAINALRVFLTSIGMQQYLDGFIESGYDGLDVISEMTETEMEEDVGIGKKGHRKRIIMEIRKKYHGEETFYH